MNGTRIILITAVLFVDAAFGASSLTKRPVRTPADHEIVLAVGADTIKVQIRTKAGAKVTDIDPLTGAKTLEYPDNIVTYHITQGTEINVDGLPSKLADVKTGMKIIVDVGATPTDAARVIANTVPPPVPKSSATRKPPAKSKKGAGVKKGFRKITEDKVIAIRSDRITAAQDGADKAVAYFITQTTSITVNGQPAQAADIKPGMHVRINAASQYDAATIEATGGD